MRHGLAEWLADAHDNCREDVLVTGHEEEGRIFRVCDIGPLGVKHRLLKPRLTTHNLEADGLDEHADDNLSEEWCENFAGYEACRGTFAREC